MSKSIIRLDSRGCILNILDSTPQGVLIKYLTCHPGVNYNIFDSTPQCVIINIFDFKPSGFTNNIFDSTPRGKLIIYLTRHPGVMSLVWIKSTHNYISHQLRSTKGNKIRSWLAQNKPRVRVRGARRRIKR